MPQLFALIDDCIGNSLQVGPKTKKHRMIMMMVLKHGTVCVILHIRLEVQINQNINEIRMLSSATLNSLEL